LQATVRALYALTIFASAFLLFAVQPMIGKAMLPRLGGVPGAWTACLLFFQAALLVGYGYVWLGARLLGPRTRVIVHCVLLALPLAILAPFARLEGPSAPAPEAAPIAWALVFATINVGLPFTVLSATGPLLSHWFGLVSEKRPYFLYAASNAGSLGALIVYPFAIEPWLELGAQATVFRVAFAIVAVCVIAAGVVVVRAPRVREEREKKHVAALSWRQRLTWIGLAFVPTMLLAGSSSHLALDLAPVPLLWIVPLAIYLLSFIAAFSDWIPAPSPWIARGACIVAVVLVFVTVTHANEPLWLIALLHVLFLGAGSWIAHRRLADSAPDTAHLPEFYTLIALGGVLGTLVSAVLAPTILPDHWEYPAAIALACMTREVSGVVVPDRPWKTDLPHVAITLAVALGFLLATPRLGIDKPHIAALVSFGPAAIYAYRWMPLRRRFTLCLLALIAVGTLAQDRGERRFITRSFFGVLRVVDEHESGKRHLLHGTTLHGTQDLASRERCTPLAYYDRSGPLGRLFAAHRARGGEGRTVAIGLGTGAIACYAAPAEPWRFIEINPDVIEVARDPRWFTYLRESPSDRVALSLGDGRVMLAEERDRSLALIIVDAFNSDSVPVHLLTREALRLYLGKLEDGGWAALHLSNRVLDLRAVVGDVVRAEGAVARISEDENATWVVVARREQDFNALDPSWAPLHGDGRRAWSDSFSSLFGVVMGASERTP
jgi:spermidine synthase